MKPTPPAPLKPWAPGKSLLTQAIAPKTPRDTVKHLFEVYGRDAVMSAMESHGIEWNHSPYVGVNVMRASVALNTYISAGNSFTIPKE